MKAFRRPFTHYALTNHLGNVLAVISDAPGGGTQPTVESLTDYYPFGMAMPGRSYNASAYRFGYTGHEKEGDLAEDVFNQENFETSVRLFKSCSDANSTELYNQSHYKEREGDENYLLELLYPQK